MSQYDWVNIDPDDEDGTELSARLNAWVAAVLSQHRGSAAPAYVTTGLEWQKDISSTVAEIYRYDGAQSVLLYTINPTAHTVQIPAAALPAASDSVPGAVEFSTTTEQLTGTATNRGSTPDSIAALWEKGADNSNGATITLGEGGSFNLITSTAAITSFVFTNDKAGRRARIRFGTIRTLTNNSAIAIPGGANVTTVAGDICEIESLGSGNVRVNWYTRADGTPLAGGGTGRLLRRWVYTADATWTKPSDLGFIIVKAQAAGGGGGGAKALSPNTAAGSGAGAGGYAEKKISAVSLGSTVSVTIGAAGTGGAGATPANGTDGGAVAFGSHVTCDGGTHGLLGNSTATNYFHVGGTGGTTTGGDLACTGQNGNVGYVDTTSKAQGGAGGDSMLGRGGAGSVGVGGSNNQVPGADATGYGGGGAGGYSIGVGTADGGDGGPGVIIVEEYS